MLPFLNCEKGAEVMEKSMISSPLAGLVIFAAKPLSGHVR